MDLRFNNLKSELVISYRMRWKGRTVFQEDWSTQRKQRVRRPKEHGIFKELNDAKELQRKEVETKDEDGPQGRQQSPVSHGSYPEGMESCGKIYQHHYH